MTMIEKVARALERARHPEYSDDEFEAYWNCSFFSDEQTAWSFFCGSRKGKCLFEARAAIEAMRKPTTAMLNGTRGIHVSGLHIGEDDADVVWDHMIEAALTEPATASPHSPLQDRDGEVKRAAPDEQPRESV